MAKPKPSRAIKLLGTESPDPKIPHPARRRRDGGIR